MKFFEVDTDYFINLEDISIFHIYMMDAADYNGYNKNRPFGEDNYQYILHVVYKSCADDIGSGSYYPLTAYRKYKFEEAIKNYVV